MTGLFGRGYISDAGKHFRTDARHLFAKRSFGEVVVPSLAPFAPFTFQQGATGACVGHGYAKGINASLAAQGTPLGFIVSPASIYTPARGIDRVFDASGRPTTPLTDGGSTPNQAARAIGSVGVRALDEIIAQFLGYYTDVDPATVNRELTLDELEASLDTILVGEYQITSIGDQRTQDIAKACRAGHAVIIALQGDKDSIQQYDGRALSLADLGTNLDHCVVVLAVFAIGNDIFFLLGNSWGTSKADAYGIGWGVSSFTLPGMPLGPNYPANGCMIVKPDVLAASDTLIVLDLYKRVA